MFTNNGVDHEGQKQITGWQYHAVHNTLMTKRRSYLHGILLAVPPTGGGEATGAICPGPPLLGPSEGSPIHGSLKGPQSKDAY